MSLSAAAGNRRAARAETSPLCPKRREERARRCRSASPRLVPPTPSAEDNTEQVTYPLSGLVYLAIDELGKGRMRPRDDPGTSQQWVTPKGKKKKM